MLLNKSNKIIAKKEGKTPELFLLPGGWSAATSEADISE